ncbi:phosphatidylinositol kinase (PIK-G3) [Achlya hypogyna]|uniref:1-phosphatidylinositol 4-kinase n=1 Tax=Achlya hypogyna TaxID=1202772 RepID=A0A1V9ZS50_ACHHY|nr:phosphatidylinositol kinase (PIK-G3) [Achlya hypogyna]
MVSSSSEDAACQPATALNEYAYKGHLSISIVSDSDDADTAVGSVFCWLRRSGTLTWSSPSQQELRNLECQLAFADDKDFLNERFFISTPSGQLVTCGTKSEADRDGWLLALQLVLEKRSTVAMAPAAEAWTSLAARQACADAVLAHFRDWHALIQLLAGDPLGLFKETRHWGRLGATDKGRFRDLATYMDGGAVDACALVVGLYQYAQAPFLFVATLAQLALLVEADLPVFARYWPQVLHWGFTHLHRCQSMAMQVFYVAFVAAVSRRSPVLALQAHWECTAARTDGAKTHDFDACFSAALMQLYASYVGQQASAVTTTMTATVLGPTASDHDAMQLLDQHLHAVRALLAQSRYCLFGAWLGAATDADVDASTAAIDAHCDGQYRFLPPFPDAPTPPQESLDDLRGQIIPGEADDLIDCLDDVLAELAAEAAPAPPPVDVFGNTLHLVQSLVVASQNFKRQFTNGKERKRHLPEVLARLASTLPPHACLPLAIGDDVVKRVVATVATEGTVFSTKARAPTLVYFETTMAVDRSRRHGVVVTPTTDADADAGFLIDAFLALDLSRHRRASVPTRSSSRSQPHSDDSAPPSLVADCPMAVKLLEESPGGRLSTVVVDAKESFEHKKRRLQGESAHGSVASVEWWWLTAGAPGWDLVPVIAKSFDDMRQEVFIMQLMHLFCEAFEGTELLLRPYAIMCCGDDCGLMEVLVDADSLSDVKKAHAGLSLVEIFARRYPTSSALTAAQDLFVRSMAAYSLFSYVLQIKDRHNGNVMLHDDGAIMHIDFGFAFGIAPGGRFSFERAPFKLTEEMVGVMGGRESPGFQRYQRLVGDGLIALQEQSHRILALVAMTSKRSPFPCFQNQTVPALLRRLQDRLCVGMTEPDIRVVALRLIDQSCNSLRTRLYDRYQYHSNGYVS